MELQFYCQPKSKPLDFMTINFGFGLWAQQLDSKPTGTSQNGLKVKKAGHKSECCMSMMADRHFGQTLCFTENS